MENLIEDSVGNNMNNDEQDVRAVKGALNELDRYDEEEPHGIITRETDDAIRKFQGDKDLKVDGILFPDGETEKALMNDLETNRNLPPVPQRKPKVPENFGKEKGIKRDCSSFEVALDNATSLLDQRQEKLNESEEKLREASENAQEIMEKLGKEKKGQKESRGFRAFNRV